MTNEQYDQIVEILATTDPSTFTWGSFASCPLAVIRRALVGYTNGEGTIKWFEAHFQHTDAWLLVDAFDTNYESPEDPYTTPMSLRLQRMIDTLASFIEVK